MVCVEYWRGLHVDLHPPTHSLSRSTRTALARRNARDAVVLRRQARLLGKAGRQGGVVGSRSGGGQSRVVGRVG